MENFFFSTPEGRPFWCILIRFITQIIKHSWRAENWFFFDSYSAQGLDSSFNNHFLFTIAEFHESVCRVMLFHPIQLVPLIVFVKQHFKHRSGMLYYSKVSKGIHMYSKSKRFSVGSLAELPSDEAFAVEQKDTANIKFPHTWIIHHAQEKCIHIWWTGKSNPINTQSPTLQ